MLQSDGSAGGLYYLSARHYDPNSGRFLQQDTYKGDAMSPWTQNLYAYTSNNPVNYVDPTGHWMIEMPGSKDRTNALLKQLAKEADRRRAAEEAERKRQRELYIRDKGTRNTTTTGRVTNVYDTGVSYYDPEQQNNINYTKVVQTYEPTPQWFYDTMSVGLLLYGMATCNAPLIVAVSTGYYSGYTQAEKNGASRAEAEKAGSRGAAVTGSLTVGVQGVTHIFSDVVNSLTAKIDASVSVLNTPTTPVTTSVSKSGRAANKIVPDQQATGAHTVFRLIQIQGKLRTIKHMR
ncbi:RHS repeat-associated core domain-containing protein [Eubacteriales bacterium OttesenSCG-928-M02]|nr:RHS repeat-associated core domain-containing protein [Eubacteriales bacterium OttesenSCG-928-M02]